MGDTEMTPAEEHIHWQAQWETYANACKEKYRERKEALEEFGYINPEYDAMLRRLFVKYLRLAREARGHLDAMEGHRHAA